MKHIISSHSHSPALTVATIRRVDISTNQPAVQVYTAYWLDTPRKVVHGGPTLSYSKWSAVAIEQQGYIDAINTPEFNVDQICGYLPSRRALLPIMLIDAQITRVKTLNGARHTSFLSPSDVMYRAWNSCYICSDVPCAYLKA